MLADFRAVVADTSSVARVSSWKEGYIYIFAHSSATKANVAGNLGL